MVRVNQLERGIEDLRYVVPHHVHAILLPKCESAQQVKNLEAEVERLKKMHGIRQRIYFVPIIESAKGVMNAYAIASSSGDNCALAIGLEDYTADIGVQRTVEGKESFFARSTVVNAAKAAGIQALDTVFSDIDDMEGLRQSVLDARSLGFDGKGCIHPRQIKVTHNAFAPAEDEIGTAMEIVRAFEDAKKKGTGVVAIGSKMIDAPVVKRAQRIIDLAIKAGLLAVDWRNRSKHSLQKIRITDSHEIG